MRSPALQAATRRASRLRAVLVLAFAVLALRAAHLTLDPDGERRAEGQLSTSFALPPARGLIVDRRGAELAITIHAPSVYVMPRELADRSATLRALAQALDLSSQAIARKLDDRERFTYVARWVSEEQRERVEALALPGVGIVREPRRAYPAEELAATLIGFANIDGIGARGIEQQENEWLSGTRHVVPVERDARGRLFTRNILRPRDSAGGDVALTIDATLQAEAEAALREVVERTAAKGGTIVTMDPATGDILSLAEAPSFDPNRFWTISFPQTRSRSLLDASEPGSTLKVFLVAAALDAGVIEADELIHTGRGVRVPGKTIRDRRDFGPLTIGDILRVSSNVGAVHIAQMLGREEHFQALSRFGFGRRTGTGFPHESAGLLRPWRQWTPLDHATIAFGQGISVTPLQLASATAALANGGELMQPRLVAARRTATGTWNPTPIVRVGRAVRADTAATLLAMMEKVVAPDGTGRRAALRDLAVAGKTGTAQKLDVEKGTYARDRFTAWFIGAVPAEDPKLVIVVAVDEPKGVLHGGGSVAAPLFAEVAAAQLAHFGISTAPARLRPAPMTRVAAAAREAPEPRAKAKKASTDKPEAVESVVVARASGIVLMPDFVGETVSGARRIARSAALDLEIPSHALGRAVSQDPPPGTVLDGSTQPVRIRFAPTRES